MSLAAILMFGAFFAAGLIGVPIGLAMIATRPTSWPETSK